MNSQARWAIGGMTAVVALGLAGTPVSGQTVAPAPAAAEPAATGLPVITNAPVSAPVRTNTSVATEAPVIQSVSAYTPAVAWYTRTDEPREAGDPWWRDRVEVGTRVTSFSLSDTDREPGNHYLGSINTLKEEQDYAPVKLFANIWPLPWLGAGISYEKMGVETWTVEAGYDSYSDGTFDVDGPILSLLAAWPNATRFKPYAELGFMIISASFDADPAWANAHGIEGYQDFEVTSEDGGLVWGLGCAVQLAKGIEMDVIFRQLDATLIVDHVLMGSVAHSGNEFPLDSSWLGAGVKYRF